MLQHETKRNWLDDIKGCQFSVMLLLKMTSILLCAQCCTSQTRICVFLIILSFSPVRSVDSMVLCNRQNHSEPWNITYSVRSGVTTDNRAYFQVTNPAVVSWDQLINKTKHLTQQTASNFNCSYTFRPCTVSISLTFIIITIIIIINIKDWTLWSVPSPELQLLAPTLLRSSNCSPSLWSIVVWFQRDSVLWHSLQV